MKARALALAFALCATSAHAKTYNIKPGPTAQADLAAAIGAAKSKDKIQFGKGRYEFTGGFAFSTSQLTLRGDGADKSVLSFTGQSAPGPCLQFSGAQVALTGFAVENCNGDAIVAQGADQISMSALRAEWPGAKPALASGIAAISAKNVLVDAVIVRGASNAGVRISQSSTVVIKDSVIAQSTIGLALENTIAADASRNTLTHNAVGAAVYDLPGAAQYGRSARLFGNQIVANDGAGLAPAGSFAASLPAGTGIVVTATRDVHVLDNQIGENGSVNVLITSYRGASAPDAKFNALARNVAVRGNQFGRTGFAPGGDLKTLAGLGVKLPDILWDGADTYFAGGASHQEPVLLAIDRNTGAAKAPVSFVRLGLITAGADFGDMQPTTTFPPITNVPEPPEVKLPKGM